jgi:hypothetical protein
LRFVIRALDCLVVRNQHLPDLLDVRKMNAEQASHVPEFVTFQAGDEPLLDSGTQVQIVDVRQ